ncbi:hypothetical protein PTSG_02255 [Salpingoeca rosetta]|uniref:Succinate dehydrogenase [ubiquinone] cytochrome b small subunit n=1 Tax=Salpingoeca rosetta (strain ATCC 50818 / BSB-021) TaxID=946362 RepID=F2U1N4_SALR5|nr:uncharacterized protein PTSG_02255 [Salpingoeca rosetta]EGD81536.1 hypothetical protein PTSG_02255 [Salpingoeca rosetta]|eukprot:XP_004996740.1 hypothetical protein PTSG_02255 [Salpingoeca rosetta]
MMASLRVLSFAAARPQNLLHLCRPATAPLLSRVSSLHTSAPRNAVATKSTSDTTGLGHWKLERVVSVALVGLVPAAFVAPGPFVDYSLAVTMPLHTYMGMDCVFTDYVHGAMTKPLAKFLNAVVHVGALGGLLYFNAHDVGISEGLKTVWAL